jgi:DNA-binding CsgD family transcriptional regulator
VPQVLCPVLVGRDEEARRLRAALAAAGAGRGSAVFLAGEAGIGKSRLVREIARAAGDSGLTVLAGRAVAGGAPTPFRPFAEALTSAARTGRLPASEELGPFRPVLGRLIPEWRPSQPAPGEESPVFLGEAVLRLLRALAPQAGCVLVLEDLHWADQETLALLEYLADNLTAERVLCLVTLREEGGEAAALASALAARGSATVLSLGRLDPAAMADMTRACLDAADLPDALHEFVAGRAEGIPFLVEEVLAGLVGEGALTERGGRWHAADLSAPGVPATFADAIRRRLDSMGAETRQVIGAAAVLGRRFEWTLLGQVTGLADAAVIAALRDGVGLQVIVAERDSFRFRHALTHEAVLAGLLPPERTVLAGRALAAAEAAHPGLPGGWCTVAADLAGRAGDTARAGALLLEAGRRDLAAGALASAEHTLTRAVGLVGPALRTSVDEALTEVFAMSGQVDRAIETGRMLLARLGPAPAANLHLGIARAAIAGARWAEAAASVEVARKSAGADTAEIDACAAQVAAGQGRLEEAGRLAQAALQAAESGPGHTVQPEVACEALEVIGRVARQRDLEAAERAFARAADIAAAHGLQLWRLRALHELGTIDQLRTESVHRLEQARELAVTQGALALTATLDLQISAGLNKQFRAEEALAAALRSADASRRFHLATLPMALIFQATAYATRGEEGPMEGKIAEAVALAPDDPDVLGCAWGHCRATFWLLAADLRAAHARMTTGAGLMLSSPATIAPPFLGLWPLLGALLGRDAAGDPAGDAARVRAAHGTRHLVVAALLGYADAIRAGRQGHASQAEAAFAAADRQMGPLVAWYRQYARRLAAEAALADGWGEPVAWLREAAAYFAARGDDRVAAACRALLRLAGAPVPRHRAGDDLPGPLRALGVTEREADVLRLAAQGLGNREIAERMFLSPRTVEKHVASLLAKTGLRRAQLAGYSAGLDGYSASS